MYKRLFENENITDEMAKHFYKRTKMHIKAIQTFASRILQDKELMKFINREEFIKDIENHDQSKFEDPEVKPYIRLTWRQRFAKTKSYKKPGELDDPEINEATLHHIKNSKHHPEFWAKQKNNQEDNILSKGDRTKSPALVDATNMPLTYVASMTADWMAMSKELNDNPYDWMNKNIGKRWKFTKEQEDFMKMILDHIWEK